MKKILCVFILFSVLIFSLGTAGAEDEKYIFISLNWLGKEVLKEKFYINPDFLLLAQGREKKIIQSLQGGFSQKDLLNYLFCDLGDKAWAVFDEIECVDESDCIEIDKREYGKFKYYPERSGFRVIREDFFKKIVENFGKNIVYDIKTEKCEQKFTKNYLKSCTDKIGEYSTLFVNSSEGRKKNIVLATQKIDGCVLRKGENFSFNEAVGKRTAENGFSDAKIILDGEYADGVGGGVCQVATTLYNAVLRANLTVLECHRHTLAPSYVPLSFDAMVSEWSDLKFKNTGDAPIFILAKSENGVLDIAIFGKGTGVELEFESVVSEVVRHENWTEDSTNYKNGYKSQGYKIVKSDGRVIERILLRNDYYKPYEIKVKEE